MSKNLAFKSFFQGLSKKTIREIGLLAFRIILKLCCKLSSKYLMAENKIGVGFLKKEDYLEK